MSYTRDGIFEKIIEKLPTLKIHERREKDNREERGWHRR